MQDTEQVVFATIRAASFGTAAELNNAMKKYKCKNVLWSLLLWD